MEKVFSGLLSQEGTNDPTIELFGNAIGNIDLQYNDVGGVLFVSNGLFPAKKTTIEVWQMDGTPVNSFTTDCINGLPNVIGLNGYINGIPSNGTFTDAYVKITVRT